jgi:hypothetical protein
MLLRLGAQPAITFLREVAFDTPEPIAQRGVIGGPVQRGPEPAGQPAHPAIGLVSAGKRVEPDLKRSLPGRFGLLPGETLGPGRPQLRVPAAPLVDPYDALSGQVLDLEYLIEQVDRPSEQFADVVSGEDVQGDDADFVRHTLTLAYLARIMHPLPLIAAGQPGAAASLA